MIYFKSLDIVKKWKKLFENCSGLKVSLIDPKFFQQPHKLPCAYKCANRNCPCELSFSRISGLLAKRKLYIYPCPRNYSVTLVPIIAEGRISGLACAFRHANNSVSRRMLSDFSKLLYEAVNYLYKFECPSPTLPGITNGTRSREVLKRATKYICEYYYQSSLSLKEVARHNNVSYHYLSHIFSKYTGMTFIQYLTKVRVEKSVKFLKNLKLTISQVAYAAGYEDPGYFCKVFKKHTRLSPETFRNRFYRQRSPAGSQANSAGQDLSRLVKKRGNLSGILLS
jgi:two-component system response regulator YesN